LGDQSVSTNILANEIGKDQGLTAKVLSIANSPLYGLQRKVTSLEFAIIVLGFKEMSDIVTAVSLTDAIKVTGDKFFNQNDFWIHSLVVGTTAKNISQNLGHLDIGSDDFVAGILHDIGIQILFKFFNTQFRQVVSLVKDKNYKIENAEIEILGLSHQDIGKFLANKWNLPDVLGDVLCHHHKPSTSSNNKVIPSIVHLADYMTQKFKIGGFYWDENMLLDEDIVSVLDFKNSSELENFIQNYKNLYLQTATSAKI
jgi:HD-like signal output (HDOD) protein